MEINTNSDNMNDTFDELSKPLKNGWKLVEIACIDKITLTIRNCGIIDKFTADTYPEAMEMAVAYSKKVIVTPGE